MILGSHPCAHVCTHGFEEVLVISGEVGMSKGAMDDLHNMLRLQI